MIKIETSWIGRKKKKNPKLALHIETERERERERGDPEREKKDYTKGNKNITTLSVPIIRV